jgi:hypothetical protein
MKQIKEIKNDFHITQIEGLLINEVDANLFYEIREEKINKDDVDYDCFSVGIYNKTDNGFKELDWYIIRCQYEEQFRIWGYEKIETPFILYTCDENKLYYKKNKDNTYDVYKKIS